MLGKHYLFQNLFSGISWLLTYLSLITIYQYVPDHYLFFMALKLDVDNAFYSTYIVKSYITRIVFFNFRQFYPLKIFYLFIKGKEIY